jgi:hypothetical protein
MSYINGYHTLIPLNAVSPMKANWIFPEVKDPKNWWGGHIWGDMAGIQEHHCAPYGREAYV